MEEKSAEGRGSAVRAHVRFAKSRHSFARASFFVFMLSLNFSDS